ncbi:hypothetical protein NDU88_003518 [Pleurodeles waltl]|uniref:Uncharacterized protein n=1 Tax=Pleurodeles waltl TaxID=8319 RepID=A0AAV7T5E0_PLEWA|nr:hypothetical protein NDU88_003518 [Pleurodeles waltl]
MEPNRVVQALKVLHDEGREDLLREGVLEQAWVGIKHPKRLSAEGVSAAVAACTTPVKHSKKFKSKSVGGRKVARSPQSDEEPLSVMPCPVAGVAGKRRGGCRFPRRQGASLSRRVAAGGRGAAPAGAVRIPGRLGARAVFAHERSARKLQRALPPVETGGERKSSSLEERALGGAPKMAAPLVSDWSNDQALEEKQLGTADKMAAPVLIEEDEVVVISDEEEGELRCQEGVGDQLFGVFVGNGSEGGVKAVYRPSGRMVGDRSTPVKVRAPSAHRPEGKARSGAVRLTSRDAARVCDA